MTLLLDAHVDVNTPNKDGVTPLIIGCYHGDQEVVGLLIQRNANPLFSDKSGNTAKTICNKYGYKSLSLQCSQAERRFTKATASTSTGRGRKLSTVSIIQ